MFDAEGSASWVAASWRPGVAWGTEVRVRTALI